MADKNNIAAEDYLDSLLRSIMGEEEGTTASNNTTEDVKNDDPFGLDDVMGSKDIEEDFLSDFEKEFFDDEETRMMAELMNEVKQVESEMKPEPAHDSDDNLMSLDSIDFDGFMFDEPKEEAIPELEVGQQAVANEPQKLDDIDEDVSLLFDGFDEFDDINEMNEGVALVDEAVNKGDAQIEDDLKGLYDILGVNSANEEIPETVLAPKEKKKGFFAKLFGKKEEKDKKDKPSGKKNKETNKDAQPDDGTSALADIFGDDEDIKISSEGLDDNSIDLSSAFDMFDGMQDENANNQGDDDGMEFTDFDSAFGLDDSAFDALGSSDDTSSDPPFSEMDADSFFGNDDDDDEPSDKKGKKGKKDKKEKKEKKDKKGKNAKKDKGKNAKKAKAPKEKKPKEPDEIIEVPLIFVIFLVSFVLVAVLGASMGGDYYNYQQKVYEAVKLYVDTDQTDIDKYEKRYSEAYSLMSGLTMRDEDHKVFFNQVQTIMFMDIHYEAYKNYMLLDDYNHGLDSLIKAVKMYDKHQNTARDLGCFDDMTVILGWVDAKLNSVYGISVSRAREIYMIANDTEYATIVRAIAAEAEAAAANRVETESKGTEGAK